jgi:uncharacterized protein YprB with RNaseH-like and TPR domain
MGGPAVTFPKGVDEYIKIKLETMHNKTQVSREIKRVYNLEYDLEQIRAKVRKVADSMEKGRIGSSIKRLFFDIETSFCIGWFWRPSWKTNIGPHQIIQNSKIICICYKWQEDDSVTTLVWDDKQSDKKLLKDFVKVLNEADEIVAHNGDRFDIKEFRTRCIKEGVKMFPKYRTLDTLKKARKYFSFPSNKLDEIGKFLKLGRKLDTGGFELWERVILDNDKKALKKMVDYCKQDVILLEDVFIEFSPYIDHNTNFAVLKRKDKWACPECASENVKLSHTDSTPLGYIKRHMVCKKPGCGKVYHVSNKTYLRYHTKDFHNARG